MATAHHWLMSRKHRRPSRPATSVRGDYLRLLGDNVDAALALIVNDLVATGAMARGEAEATVRIQASIHLEFQVANALNVHAEETAVWVAEAVQEDLIEGTGIWPRMVTWPACPDHPNHPLWLRSSHEQTESGAIEVADDPVWTCITRNRAVAELGRL